MQHKIIIKLLVVSFGLVIVFLFNSCLNSSLKDGMRVELQVSLKDILIRLSNNSENPSFKKALVRVDEARKDFNGNYLDLFCLEFEKVSEGTKLSDSTIFRNRLLVDKVGADHDNLKVKEILKEEINLAIQTSIEVLKKRFKKFGVIDFRVQYIENLNRILVELPGVKDVDRITKLITTTSKLEFWEVYTNSELFPMKTVKRGKGITLIAGSSLEKVGEEEVITNYSEYDSLVDTLRSQKQKELSKYLIPNKSKFESSIIGYSKVKDTAKVNALLNSKEVYSLLPEHIKWVKFLWDYKSSSIGGGNKSRIEKEVNPKMIALYAIKSNRDDKPVIDGDAIIEAEHVLSPSSIDSTNWMVSTKMDPVGTKKWAKVTANNVDKFIALVFNNHVYATPIVNSPITTGETQISGGSITKDEAKDIAITLAAGELSVLLSVIRIEVVESNGSSVK